MPVLEYGLVVTSVVGYCNELRRRGCSVALHMHMHALYWHMRARARVSVYIASARAWRSKETRA